MRNRTRPWRGQAKAAKALPLSTGRAERADEARFIELLSRMAPLDRRVITALMARLADTEARWGQAAALHLIDDIELLMREPDGGLPV